MREKAGEVRIGTAGWAIPRAVADRFPADGSGLKRYAARFDAAEINTTFYRPHRPETFARWAGSTPEHFRFAVKAPRAVTHERRLREADEVMGAFLEQVSALGDRLGPVLVQLPPTLAHDDAVAGAFFDGLRRRWAGLVALEPRHSSWFTPEVDAQLAAFRVARVAADPAKAPGADAPGGWPGLVYHRLHGSPVMYRSTYAGDRLAALARTLSIPSTADRWCVFDNTASGAAAADALALRGLLAAPDSV